MLTLASEAQAVGLASDMRRRFADSSALQSPFGQLVGAVEAFLASRDPVSRDELTSVVDDCLALLATVHTRLTAPSGRGRSSLAFARSTCGCPARSR